MKSSSPSYGYVLFSLLVAAFGAYELYEMAFVPAVTQTFSCDRGANACVLRTARGEVLDVEAPTTVELDRIASSSVVEHTSRRSTRYHLELRLKPGAGSETVEASRSTPDDETVAELRKASRAIEGYLAATDATLKTSWTFHVSAGEVAAMIFAVVIFGPAALILAGVGRKKEELE